LRPLPDRKFFLWQTGPERPLPGLGPGPLGPGAAWCYLKKEYAQGDDDDTYVDRNSPDPDARFGRKSKKKGFYGYKAHIVEDAESELIVGLMTTPGNVPDGLMLPHLIKAAPQEVTG